MKKIILGALIAASLAAPALAQVSINIGPEVREYVVREQRPSVVYQGEVAVGATLSNDVEFYEIQGQPTYRYTVVNDRRVIVDPATRRVIQVIE